MSVRCSSFTPRETIGQAGKSGKRVNTPAGLSSHNNRVKWHSLPALALAFASLPFLSLAGSPALAAESMCSVDAGSFVQVENVVEVQADGAPDWVTADVEQMLCQGDTIRVGTLSKATVKLINDANMVLAENTTIKLLDIVDQDNERSFLEITAGKLKTFIRRPRTLSVSTPHLNGMIEGTEFLVIAEAESSTVLLFEGVILAQNDQGQVTLAPGEEATASAGTAPVRVIRVNPRDAVQWALFYPDVLSSPASGTAAQAAGLLAAGRVDEAEALLRQALAADAGDTDALSVMSVIQVVKNERDAALELGQRAVTSDPDSASALVALSYAQQAVYDLDAALESLETAVAVEPDNALAWARLAELQSSFGLSSRSLASANRSVSLDASLSRPHTVLGFSSLGTNDDGAAADSFTTAIMLDQADPLPRLGLGLAYIASGELTEGRRQIDSAAALDPNNAVIRSYLGKGYYEEKRSPLDEQQFGIAQQLDPLDPTPWFYQAIAMQTSNRPVQALASIEEAIERNDNRAVYRSTLLLDSDLAARSASVGRIYGDLGFEELALREGWKGVITDPSNFSAHRLLADSYAALPRHEIARVSELYQSQMLQPLSMTPIQPRLAISNLALISAGGAGAVSFNEFNPVFYSEGLTGQVSVFGGEMGSKGQEVVVAGLYGDTSFSIGGFHYETDGFRQNGDQQEDAANIYVQHEVSPLLTLQAELRYRDSDSGDLVMRFFPEDYYAGQRLAEESGSARLGAKFSFSPGSVLLASMGYQEMDRRTTFEPFPAPGFELLDQFYPDTRGQFGELQYLFRADWLSITAGGGYFDVDGQIDTTLRFGPPIAPPGSVIMPPTEPFIVRHTNAYTYAQIAPADFMTVIVGASYDDIGGEFPNEEMDELNPKVGVVLEPFEGTTIRAAGFDTVKRTLITNQTLEPTQVAGFNQFYDDYDLTQSTVYGGAIDQKFGSRVAAGIEYTERELEIPYLTASGSDVTQWDESLWRAYLFWTPTDIISLSLKYEYEELERALSDVTQGVVTSETSRIPVSLGFFGNDVASFSLTGTWVDQEGVFGSPDFMFLHPPTDPVFRPGSDDFWLFDAALNFRLPNRHGLITIGVNNLFDEEFNYFDQDLKNMSFQPERMMFAKITITLP